MRLDSIELFSGAGGLALGLHLAGFRHRALIESNVDACATLALNSARDVLGTHDWNVIEADARSINFRVFSDIDLVAGGAPCQPFSVGGIKRGVRDQRNMLPTFLDAIRSVRPRAFLLENVQGLLNHSDAVRLISEAERSLTSSRRRYAVETFIADAADFGVPQHRVRVFFVGRRLGDTNPWVAPESTHGPMGSLPWLTTSDALGDLSRYDSKLDHEFHSGARAYVGHTPSRMDRPAKTLKAGVNGVPGGENTIRARNGRIRYFTIREAARIQSFPDEWCFCGSWSSRFRQIGNAVPVQLAYRIGCSLRNVLR